MPQATPCPDAAWSVSAVAVTNATLASELEQGNKNHPQTQSRETLPTADFRFPLYPFQAFSFSAQGRVLLAFTQKKPAKNHRRRHHAKITSVS